VDKDKEEEEEEAPVGHKSDSINSFHAPNTLSEINASAEGVDSALAAPRGCSHKKVTAVSQNEKPCTHCGS
jgi:hypothetical protein